MPIGNTHSNSEPPLLRRLGWFALLWLGGVASVAAVSLVLRYWLHP